MTSAECQPFTRFRVAEGSGGSSNRLGRVATRNERIAYMGQLERTDRYCLSLLRDGWIAVVIYAFDGAPKFDALPANRLNKI